MMSWNDGGIVAMILNVEISEFIATFYCNLTHAGL